MRQRISYYARKGIHGILIVSVAWAVVTGIARALHSPELIVLDHIQPASAKK